MACKYVLVVLWFFANASSGQEKLLVLTEHLPPYQIVKNNQVLSGTAYQMVKDALKQANISFEVKILPWARAFKIAQLEPNVLIFSLIKSDERENLFHWVAHLNTLTYRYYSLKSRPDVVIEHPSDALDYIAVGVLGSYESNALAKFGFNQQQNLVLVKDHQTAWQMLKLGRADLSYAAHIPSLKQIDKSDFYEHPIAIEKFELYVAVSLKTSPELVEKLKVAFTQVLK